MCACGQCFNCLQRMAYEQMQRNSVSLPGGGDTHFHMYGQNEDDYVVTTRLRGSSFDTEAAGSKELVFHEKGKDIK